jgi:hypothetical protein
LERKEGKGNIQRKGLEKIKSTVPFYMLKSILLLSQNNISTLHKQHRLGISKYLGAVRDVINLIICHLLSFSSS